MKGVIIIIMKGRDWFLLVISVLGATQSRDFVGISCLASGAGMGYLYTNLFGLLKDIHFPACLEKCKITPWSLPLILKVAEIE